LLRPYADPPALEAPKWAITSPNSALKVLWLAYKALYIEYTTVWLVSDGGGI